MSRRAGVCDFLAATDRHVGIDAERVLLLDGTGRPLPEGRPIPELTRA